MVALILGLTVAISGYWLGSLNGSYTPESHFEVTGWMLHVFGCAILWNDNNLAPSFWLFLIGLFLIIITQYKTKTKHKPKEKQILDRKALRSKFMYSVAGLFLGLLIMIYGVIFAESGINLCPAYLVPNFQYRDGYIWLGPLIVLVGIVIITVTRYRIRVYENPEIEKQSKS